MITNNSMEAPEVAVVLYKLFFFKDRFNFARNRHENAARLNRRRPAGTLAGAELSCCLCFCLRPEMHWSQPGEKKLTGGQNWQNKTMSTTQWGPAPMAPQPMPLQQVVRNSSSNTQSEILSCAWNPKRKSPRNGVKRQFNSLFSTWSVRATPTFS